MKSEKNKEVPKGEDKNEKRVRVKKENVSENGKRLGEFIWAFTLVKSIEAQWNKKEIVLSFEKREDMIPFMHLGNCVFVSKGNCVEQVEVV